MSLDLYKRYPRAYLSAPDTFKDPIMVESLSSYLNRVAYQNMTTPIILYSEILQPKISKKTRRSFFSTDGHSMVNGYRQSTLDYIQITEELTMKSDLECHTLYPFNRLLDSKLKGVFKKQFEWCPTCYIESMNNNLTCHNALIWSMEVISSCPIHHVKLHSRCYKCDSVQQSISTVRKNGFCIQCGSFLGLASSHSCTLSCKEENFIKFFSERDRLLSMQNPSIYLNKGITKAIKGSGLNSVAEFERYCGFPDRTVAQWLNYRYKPSLSKLVLLSEAIGIDLASLIFNHEQIILQKNDGMVGNPEAKSAQRMIYNIEEDLLKIVNSKEYTTIKSISESTGLGVSYLKYNHPKLIRKIIKNNYDIKQRNKELKQMELEKKIHDAVEKILSCGLNPSYRKVRSLIPDYGKYGYSQYTKTWRKVVKEIIRKIDT